MINTNKLAFLPLGETMGLPRNESNSISAQVAKGHQNYNIFS